jgi:ureidoacrylate peracid hydrolase
MRGVGRKGKAMHAFTMPPQIVERVVKKRGRVHAFDTIEAARTALIVVDLQNAFMLADVAHTLCEMAPRIVPNVNRLARALRETGGTVAWIRTKAATETLEDWSTYYDLLTPEARQRRLDALAEGSLGYDFWPELAIEAHDLIVTKLRYSAFIQGSSGLAEQLRARGIDTVLITGCVTNVCCESTARDAMMLNFKTIMVSDGNAAANDQEHANALIAFYLHFGDVLTTEEVIEALSVRARARAHAPA